MCSRAARAVGSCNGGCNWGRGALKGKSSSRAGGNMPCMVSEKTASYCALDGIHVTSREGRDISTCNRKNIRRGGRK